MHYASNQYQFKPCDLNDCQHSSRLYRVSDVAQTISSQNNDPSLRVIGDIFDGIHHYIFNQALDQKIKLMITNIMMMMKVKMKQQRMIIMMLNLLHYEKE